LFEFLKTRELHIRSALTRAEGRWFDSTRRVDTAGYIALEQLTLAGSSQSGNDYLAVRPSVARQALARLPKPNYEEYTFVDLGSGKGRMLLVAAEYPFRKIQGVEFAVELHREAEQNILRYRHRGRRCRDIRSLYMDAAEYVFPEGNLVLYLYNPFGLKVMKKVFANLEKAIAHTPRHVVVIMVNPEFASVADSMPSLRLYYETRRFRIYQTAHA
jgi:predicted RNA methylase